MTNTRILLLAFTLAVTGALAQAPADETKAPPKATDAKKAPAPKKTETAKKADPAKKSTPAKKPAPAKSPAPANSSVRVYKAGDPNAPKVLDKDGKPIPTNPEAYDVSSATKK